MLFALMNPEERGWLSKVKAQQPLLLNSHLGWKPGVHGFLSEKKKTQKKPLLKRLQAHPGNRSNTEFARAL